MGLDKSVRDFRLGISFSLFPVSCCIHLLIAACVSGCKVRDAMTSYREPNLFSPWAGYILPFSETFMNFNSQNFFFQFIGTKQI